MRLGTKHFAPGAKLYCFPQRWGDGGERIWDLGRHRCGGPKLIRIIVDTKWLTDWRVQRVFQPHVLREMRDSWDDSEQSKEIAEGFVSSRNARV
jgi:hypothetical protein